MNGRLYDPLLHRFLSPDNYVQGPTNTQNFNRYGYVLNNPLSHVDPSGEFIPLLAIAIGALIGAASGGAAYIGSALRTGNWSWGQFGLSVLGGAVIGGITGGINPMSIFSAGSLGGIAATGFAAGLLPSVNGHIGDFSFSISPAIAFGQSFGVGANLSVGYSSGKFAISAGLGYMAYGNYQGFGKSGSEIRESIMAAYDDGRNGFSLGTNNWSGTGGMETFGQRTGSIGLHFGNFKALYENDGGFGIKNIGLGDKGDSYRTAALNLNWGDYSLGFNLFTGYRDLDYEKSTGMSDENGKFSPVEGITSFGRKYPRGFVHEIDTPYRLGALTLGYKSYRFGTDSEHVRHAIQDKAIHGLIKDGGFQNQSWSWGGYLQYKTFNTFTSW